MAMRIHFGIDPGITGAYAIFVDGVLDQVARLPIIAHPAKKTRAGKITAKATKELDLESLVIDLRAIKARYPGAYVSATIERVGENAMPSRPGQKVSGGVVSMAKLAGVAGEIRGILAALRIDTRKVQPSVWKRKMDVTKDKDAVRAKAKRLWPWLDMNAKNKVDLAEAALIGAYGVLVDAG